MDQITEEAICGLQAQLHIQRAVLRALIATHPEPQRVLSIWRECLAEANAQGPVAADARRSDYLAEYCRLYAEDWTAELAELAVPTRTVE
jgi:hypothetical protein